MATVKQDFQASFTFDFTTTTLNSLADGADVTSNGTNDNIDFGDPAGHECVLVIALNGAGATTGVAKVYAVWSMDDSAYDTVSTDETVANDELVSVVRMNGTTAVTQHARFPVRARYMKVRVWNESGAALASSGCSVVAYEVTINQA